MPSMTVERIRERETRLARLLEEKGGAMEPSELRALKKKIRRAQRKRRKLLAAQPAPSEKKADDKPAEAKAADAKPAKAADAKPAKTQEAKAEKAEAQETEKKDE